jgi:hypothetical protein
MSTNCKGATATGTGGRLIGGCGTNFRGSEVDAVSEALTGRDGETTEGDGDISEGDGGSLCFGDVRVVIPTDEKLSFDGDGETSEGEGESLCLGDVSVGIPTDEELSSESFATFKEKFVEVSNVSWVLESLD